MAVSCEVVVSGRVVGRIEMKVSKVKTTTIHIVNIDKRIL